MVEVVAHWAEVSSARNSLIVDYESLIKKRDPATLYKTFFTLLKEKCEREPKNIYTTDLEADATINGRNIEEKLGWMDLLWCLKVNIF